MSQDNAMDDMLSNAIRNLQISSRRVDPIDSLNDVHRVAVVLQDTRVGLRAALTAIAAIDDAMACDRQETTATIARHRERLCEIESALANRSLENRVYALEVRTNSPSRTWIIDGRVVPADDAGPIASRVAELERLNANQAETIVALRAEAFRVAKERDAHLARGDSMMRQFHEANEKRRALDSAIDDRRIQVAIAAGWSDGDAEWDQAIKLIATIRESHADLRNQRDEAVREKDDAYEQLNVIYRQIDAWRVLTQP